ncbi:MAG: hypothetical protein HYX51_01375 [Chloroflexi bacterium]|nr:hypothetical protein [Chloroflexota bacterium]
MASNGGYWRRLTSRLSRRGILRSAALGAIGLGAGAAGVNVSGPRAPAEAASPTSGAVIPGEQFAGQAETFGSLLAAEATSASTQAPTILWPAAAPTPGGPSINIYPPNDTRQILIDASWIERTRQKYGAFLYDMSARVDPNAIEQASKSAAGASFIAGLEGRIMYMGDGANGHFDGLAHIGFGDVFYNLEFGQAVAARWGQHR